MPEPAATIDATECKLELTVAQLFDRERVRTEGLKDDSYAALLAVLRSGGRTSPAAVDALKHVSRSDKIALRRHNYRIVDGLIMTDHDEVVIPEGLQYPMLQYFHAVAAHCGTTTQMRLMAGRVYWPKLVNDIRDHVHECAPCQAARRGRESTTGLTQAFNVSEPDELVAVDIHGPLPLSSTDDGEFRHVLSIQDMFSRLVVFVPIGDVSTATVLRALEDCWCRVLGYPRSIVSDNGSQFISTQFAKFAQIYGIRLRRSSPYRPMGNSRIERSHRVLNTKLRAALEEASGRPLERDGLDDWPWVNYVPAAQFAMNMAPHGSTGVAPFSAHWGRRVSLPSDVAMRAAVVQNGLPELDDAKFSAVDRQLIRSGRGARTIYRRALKAQKETDKRSKQTRDAFRRPINYRVGQYVYLREPVPTNKLAIKYTGPWKIDKVRGPGDQNLLLKRVADDVLYRCNVDQVKPFFAPRGESVTFDRLAIDRLLLEDDGEEIAEDQARLDALVESENRDSVITAPRPMARRTRPPWARKVVGNAPSMARRTRPPWEQ
jgi:transposase InsO family protein